MKLSEMTKALKRLGATRAYLCQCGEVMEQNRLNKKPERSLGKFSCPVHGRVPVDKVVKL